MNTNVDNLNFKVILDDDQFNQKIKDLEATAKKFNTSMSNLLNIQKMSDQWSQKDVANNREAKKAKEGEAKAQEKINAEKAKSSTIQGQINAKVKANTKSYETQSRILKEIKTLALGYLSVHGATQLLSSLVRVTGEFELQRTTLGAMLGDLDQAEMIITRIKGLAVESPFQFKELTTYAKQLSAFSVPAEELYDTTKMLADVSAGLGVGMDRLVLAYGQVRSAAFLRGQEVRQFTEAGIPILDMLAKQFEELEGRVVSTGEVFDKISARLVPFEMVAKVFKDLTSEGGKFYMMQEVQAETLRGKVSNLKDAYEVMLNEIGEGQSERLKGAVDWLRKLMQNYEETGRTLIALISAYGLFKSALIAIDVATNTFSKTNYKLIATLAKVGKWVATNPYALLAAGLATMGGLLFKAATDQSLYEKSLEITNTTTANFNRNLSSEKNMLNYLLGRLGKLTTGTSEYNRVKSEILRNYGQYLDDVDKEKLAIGNLAGIYEKLAEKITEVQKQKSLAEGTEKLTQQFNDEYEKIFKRFDTTIEALQIEDKSIKRSLADFVRGEIGLEDLPDEAKKQIQKAKASIQAAAFTPGGMFGSGISFAGYDFERLKSDLDSIRTTVETSRKDLEDELEILYGESPTKILSDSKQSVQSREDAIDAIEREIKALQILKREFDDWKELGVDEATIATYLQQFFPNMQQTFGSKFITELDFATRLLEKIKELEKYAPEKAYDLITSLGLDKSSLEKQSLNEKIKAYEEAAKAVNKYYETLRNWSIRDFNLNGEGIALDVSKIATDLNGKINEIEVRAAKAKQLFENIDLNSEEQIANVKEVFIKEFGADAWDDFWNDYYSRGVYAIDMLSQKQQEYERKIAQEKVNDLAAKYVKEAYFSGNISFEDLSDKTFVQLRNIKKKLQDLLEEEPLSIPVEVEQKLMMDGVDINSLLEEDLSEYFDRMEISGTPVDEATKSTLLLIQSIQQAGLSTEKFGNTVRQVIGEDFKKITLEQGKALMSMVDTYMQEMQKLLSSLSEYAEVVGNDKLKGAVDGIVESMEILGSVAEKLSKGDWVGAIVSGVTSLASVIIDAVTAEERLNKAIRDTQREMRILASQNAMNEGVSSLFGDNDYKKFQNAYGEVVKIHEQAVKDIEKQNMKLTGGTDDDWGYGGLAGAVGSGAALGAAVGSIVPVIGTAIGAAVGAIVGSIVGTIGMFATQSNNFSKSLKEMADEIGAELTDADTGMYKVDTLKQIKETYEDLDSRYQDMLDDMIANATIFENAVTEIAAYMEDVFAQSAQSMASSFIDAFKESGVAALDYAEILDDVATNVAQSIIESTLIEQVFDKVNTKKAAAMLASGDAAGALGMVEEAMKAAQELSPSIQAFLDSLKQYFIMGEDEGVSLGSGIKGITEDTANLLASYLNAIRADVSYSKVLWQSMDNSLQTLATALANFSAPSLMEYQQQIAANTYNTAIATQNILSSLESVMTSDANGTGVRVYL